MAPDGGEWNPIIHIFKFAPFRIHSFKWLKLTPIVPLNAASPCFFCVKYSSN